METHGTAALAPSRLVKILTIVRDGNLTATQLRERGEYDWSMNWITDERFPILPHDPVTDLVGLYQFDHDPLWAEVLAERIRHHLDESTYEHGLYLGVEHPDEQRQHAIVVTHQPVPGPYGRPGVLVLRSSADYRGLDLLCVGSRWRRHDVFVGVREVVSQLTDF